MTPSHATPSHPLILLGGSRYQDNMNAMLEGVTVTGRDGKVTNLEQAGTIGEVKCPIEI